jgi:hypothetical protein
MNGKLFIAGVLVGGIAVVLLTSRQSDDDARPAEATPSLLETIGILPPKPEETSADAKPPPTASFLESPQYLTLRRPMDISTPYGKAHLSAGTSVWALRESERGILVKVGGREMFMPMWAFREPPPEPIVAAAAPVARTETVKPAEQPAAAPPPASVGPTEPKLAKTTEAKPTGEVPSSSSGQKTRLSADNFVVIEGASGTGSASIINMRGQPVIVTNAHVLSGNSALRFRRLNGSEVRPEKVGVSTQCDLAIATHRELQGGLPMAEDVSKDVAVEDEVVVLGNSQGSGVVTEITGKVVGVGPELVEVDAKFVEGNSGSPIVHVKSGKVIAIATFLTLRNTSIIDKDSAFNGIRRFGYRLDIAKDWEYPELARFTAEANTIRQRRHVTEMLATVFVDIDDDGYLNLGAHQSANNPARQCVVDYLRAVEGERRSSVADVIEAKRRLFRELLFLTNGGEIDTRGFTRWHAHELDRDRRVRKFLRERFTELASYQDAQAQIRRR